MAGFSWHERISSLRCCEALATSFITLPSTSTFRFIHGLILGKLVQITGLQGNYFAIKSLTMNKADGVNFIVSMGWWATCAGPAATPWTGVPASSSSGSSGPRWTRDRPPSRSRISHSAPRWFRQRPGPRPTPGEPGENIWYIFLRLNLNPFPHLDTVAEEERQFSLVGFPGLIRNQTEHVWKSKIFFSSLFFFSHKYLSFI